MVCGPGLKDGVGMSRRSHRGFQTYYGRRPSGAASFLKWIIVFLLAVLVVAVGVYFLLQERLIFDEDGVHVIPPWENRVTPPPPESPSPDPSPSNAVVVIEPDPEPTLRELAQENLQAVEVTLTGLLAGNAAERVIAAGGNAAMVEMKRPDGKLNYVSSVSLAISKEASASDTAVNLAIRELVEGDVYTIARVSCFRDHLLGWDTDYALLTNSGYRWTSNDDLRWTCPAGEKVQDYLADICVELAQIGFDEILLADCGYPTADMGPLGWIRKGDAYPAGSLDTVLGPFLAKLKEALEPYGTALSVTAFAPELMGESQTTGLTWENVLASCDHVWVDAQAAEEYENFSALEKAPGKKLVPMSDAAGETDAPWAMVTVAGAMD